jgi:uncharacterized protein YggE
MPQIDVSGKGSVKAPPTQVHLTVGVVTKSVPEIKTPIPASKENAKLMDSVIAVIRKFGIPDKNIRTSDFDVSPEFDSNYHTKTNVFLGFTAKNSLTVKLPSMDNIGELYGQLLEAGANTISSPTFSLENRKPLEMQARQLAVLEAKNKAEQIANAAGLTNLKIVAITDGAIEHRQIRLGKGINASAGMGYSGYSGCVGVPMIFAGEEEVTVDVAITFSVE